MKAKILILMPFILASFLTPNVAFAQSAWSILPSTDRSYADCKKDIASLGTLGETAMNTALSNPGVLACAIKTGEIHLYMLPYFIGYFIKFLLSIAGLIAVFFMTFGGYKWVIAGVSEQQEAAKKTIMHAIYGFVVVMLAFVIVSLIQTAVTV